jgi:hypothetical protein
MATSSRAVMEARMVMCSTGSEDPDVSGDSTACHIIKHRMFNMRKTKSLEAFPLFEALP